MTRYNNFNYDGGPQIDNKLIDWPFILVDADIQRKRPSHPLVTTSERQRPIASAVWGGLRDLFSE